MSIIKKAEEIARLFVDIVTEIEVRLDDLENGNIEYGILEVETIPSGGEVFVDQQSWGKSPVKDKLLPGKYLVSFGPLKGYLLPDPVTVFIEADQETKVTTTYTPVSIEINDFMIQYGNVDLVAIGNTKYDLVVLDYARHGNEATKWTQAEINNLQNSPGGQKKVIAYICPTMASNYRYYWQPHWQPGNPEWLGPLSGWGGSYWVKYWYKEWQNIIFGNPRAYLDQVIEQGFDGVFLDVIDAYWKWPDRPSAKEEMAIFVADICQYARTSHSGFIVIANGGDGLYEYPEYVSKITGVSKESVYYGYHGDNTPTPDWATQYMEANLDKFVSAKKMVFVLDYTQTPTQVDDSYAKAARKGYIHMCGVSSLDRLIINPGHEPD